jgi:predicted metal-dependent hydrolase
MGEVEVRRSKRRRRTVSAFYEGGKFVVAIPAHFTKAQENEWVTKMTQRVETKQQRNRRSDSHLFERALQLSTQYLQGKAQPDSVAWVTNQNRRWGSCTVQEKAIRLSHRLQPMPQYVQDYVLLHELVHLLHAGHGPGFWACLENYPHLDKARGFLEGVDYQHHLGQSESDSATEIELEPELG